MYIITFLQNKFSLITEANLKNLLYKLYLKKLKFYIMLCQRL